jgi:hypothetical protein
VEFEAGLLNFFSLAHPALSPFAANVNWRHNYDAGGYRRSSNKMGVLKFLTS